jgi:hypothetical protein
MNYLEEMRKSIKYANKMIDDKPLSAEHQAFAQLYAIASIAESLEKIAAAVAIMDSPFLKSGSAAFRILEQPFQY